MKRAALPPGNAVARTRGGVYDVPGGHQARVMLALHPDAKGEPGESASFRCDVVVCSVRAVVPQDVPTAGPRQ